MAIPDQRAVEALARQVQQQPSAFDFFQAVRLLELARPEAQEVGTGSEPLEEAVAFRGRIADGFPVSDLTAASGPDEHKRVALEVAFMCLAGADGPLPAPYTAIVQARARRDGGQGAAPAYGPDDDARNFLDLFNHRMVSFFYRARKKHRLALFKSGTAPLERLLFQLIGFHEGTLLPRLWRAGARQGGSIYSRALLRYAGILICQNRSMAGLEAMLEDALKVPVRGVEGKGRWLAIAPRFQTVIGPHGWNRALGQDTVLGTRAWEADGAIGLELGPMGLVSYRSLLPGGPAHEVLVFLTRFYLRAELDVYVTLHLEPGEGELQPLSRLGYGALNQTAWLGQQQTKKRYRTSFSLPQWRDTLNSRAAGARP